MTTGLLAAVATTILWILGHLVSMHIRPAGHRFIAMARAYLVSAPVLVALVFFLHGDATAYFYAALLHLLLFFLFVECFYHVERSVTLRLMVEILEAPRGQTSIDDIMKGYSVDDMIRRRLEDMSRSSLVTRSDGKWMLAPKGRRLARMMDFSCKIYRSKPQNERL